MPPYREVQWSFGRNGVRLELHACQTGSSIVTIGNRSVESFDISISVPTTVPPTDSAEAICLEPPQAPKSDTVEAISISTSIDFTDGTSAWAEIDRHADSSFSGKGHSKGR